MVLILLFVFVFQAFASDLYEEFVKEQVKSIPLDKAVVIGTGKEKLITFMNPDCPHCRKEWKELKPHLKKVKLYVFLLPFKSMPESYPKAYYIACAKDKLKAFDEVMSGKFDGKPPKVKECPLVYEHIKVAESLNIKGVPYNIVLRNYKVIEGYSPQLLKELGINHGF